MKKAATFLIVIPLLVIAGCGGGSSSEDEVRTVAGKVSQAETPDQIAEVCEELITKAFLDEVYEGDLEKCKKKPPNNEDEDENAGTVEVESVEIDGSSAIVAVAVEDGKIEGSGGTWTFAEDDGGWKLDRLEDDYLRSTLTASAAAVDGGAFTYEPLRKCMTGQFKTLESSKLRALMFQVLRGDDKQGLNSVLAVSKSCPGPLAGYVADQLATRVVGEQGGTPALVRCARKNLKPLLQLTGLSEMALGASIDPSRATAAGPALAGLISGAIKDCPS